MLPLPAPVGAVALKRRKAFAAPVPSSSAPRRKPSIASARSRPSIAGLTKAGVILNRKVMSEIAIRDPEGFKQLVEIAKKA